jgi:hypothetical protein
VFDLQIDKKKKKHKCVLKNENCERKNNSQSQNILHVDALYNIKRKKYKTVCAELAFASHLRQNGHGFFNKTCNMFFICCAVGLFQYSNSV